MKRKRKARAGGTQRAKKRQVRARLSVKSRVPKRRAAPTPSARSLAEKLRVRAGSAIAVLNCPKPPDALLGPMPEKASVQLTLDNPADLVLLFGEGVGSANFGQPRGPGSSLRAKQPRVGPARAGHRGQAVYCA